MPTTRLARVAAAAPPAVPAILVIHVLEPKTEGTPSRSPMGSSPQDNCQTRAPEARTNGTPEPTAGSLDGSSNSATPVPDKDMGGELHPCPVTSPGSGHVHVACTKPGGPNGSMAAKMEDVVTLAVEELVRRGLVCKNAGGAVGSNRRVARGSKVA